MDVNDITGKSRVGWAGAVDIEEAFPDNDPAAPPAVNGGDSTLAPVLVLAQRIFGRSIKPS